MVGLKGKKVLIVDDDADNIDLLNTLLGDEGYEVVSASNGAEAIRKVTSTFFSVILLDIRMPGMDGMQVLEKLKEESPQSLVIMLTAYGSDKNIKKACKQDVFDFIDKPVDNKLLLHKVRKAFQHSDALLRSEQAKKEELARYPYENIIGTNPRMLEILRIIKKVAVKDASVLITGESGTGKELIAHAIHYLSKRSLNPFIAVDVNSLPETLLESELFGYEKGAFTGANTRRYGYFESCNSGTIFIDEIGNLNLQTQAKLLRVLQEKEITRLGNTEKIKINVRIILATNKNLEELVGKESFRQDLYYRIKTVQIHLPPLRERKDDIEPLVEHFLKKYSNKAVKVSNKAKEILVDYDYPGNIREMEHIIEHALIFQEDNVILPKDLPPEVMGRSIGSGFNDIFKLPWDEAKAQVKKMYIEAILEKTKGNVSEASRISGIDRSYLHKLKKI